MTSNLHALDAATRAHRAWRPVVGLLAAVWSWPSRRRHTRRCCRPSSKTRWRPTSPSSRSASSRSLLIVLFWMVHVLPEKIAHKRHHPQLEAIKTLVPAVARLRRAALADRLAVGVHQAGRLQTGLRHRQAVPTTSRSTGSPSRRASPPTSGSAWRRSKGAVYRQLSSTPFAPTWQ